MKINLKIISNDLAKKLTEENAINKIKVIGSSGIVRDPISLYMDSDKSLSHYYSLINQILRYPYTEHQYTKFNINNETSNDVYHYQLIDRISLLISKTQIEDNRISDLVMGYLEELFTEYRDINNVTFTEIEESFLANNYELITNSPDDDDDDIELHLIPKNIESNPVISNIRHSKRKRGEVVLMIWFLREHGFFSEDITKKDLVNNFHMLTGYSPTQISQKIPEEEIKMFKKRTKNYSTRDLTDIKDFIIKVSKTIDSLLK